MSRRFWFSLSGVLLLAGLGVYYFQSRTKSSLKVVYQPGGSVQSSPPQNAEASLVAQSQKKFSEKAGKIDAAVKSGSLSIDEGARQLAEAKIELSHQRNQLQHFQKNCPGGEQWDDNVAMRTKTMDLRNCDVGKPIWLQLADSYEAQVYAVRLYMYGVGDPVTPLVL